jgi:hypothetical protein
MNQSQLTGMASKGKARNRKQPQTCRFKKPLNWSNHTNYQKDQFTLITTLICLLLYNQLTRIKLQNFQNKPLIINKRANLANKLFHVTLLTQTNMRLWTCNCDNLILPVMFLWLHRK